MKHIVIILTLLFAPTAFAMNVIEKKLQQSPTMSQRCDAKITSLQKIVDRYQRIPVKKRTALVKLKLGHFKAELMNWKEYCTDPNNSMSRGK